MVSRQRRAELEYTLRRMNSVAAVFDVRVQTVDSKAFKQFSELVELYIKGCQNALDKDVDFLDEGLVFTQEQYDQIQNITNQIFTVYEVTES